MDDFSFRTVGTIEVAWGGAATLGSRLRDRFPPGPVLVVSDGGLRGAGLLDAPLRDLAAAGYAPHLFDAVTADPTDAAVKAAAASGRERGVGLVIGLGGGSSMDVAKLAAVLLGGDGELEALYGVGRVTGKRLPLVLVPTTAGTGSEVTDIAIVTAGNDKLGVVAPPLLADLALLDASLTVGLPATHTAATGIDAMVHAIEAYTSRMRKNPVSDALAREALRLLSGALLPACRDGTNRAAREAMLLGATLAGQAFCNAPVAAVHALAYPLGARFHVPHGLSNALMLQPVLRFNARAAGQAYGELAAALDPGAVPPDAAPDAPAAQRFIAAMAFLVEGSGAPRRLRDVGVPEDALPVLAADAMRQTRLLVNNPVPVEEADALALYRQAF
ncbi:MAG: iron-containing alcohol dehydrogenase [Gluconacetobacter diazotrophicus]|nr:iron-containing alcohol dehydrogenase [Gluconacetobacter diazotrophicus]